MRARRAFLGAVGVGERVRGRGHQQRHAGLDDRRLHSGRVALLVGLDAIVSRREVRQGVRDRLVLDAGLASGPMTNSRGASL